MPIAPDDPRLTAFALGELADADRPEIESYLESNPEARALVDDVRSTARLLFEHLRAEPTPGPAPQLRQAIENRLEPEPRPGRNHRRRWAELAVAAGLLGLSVTLLIPTVRSFRKAPDRVVVERQFAQARPAVDLLNGRAVRILDESRTKLGEAQRERFAGEKSRPGSAPDSFSYDAPRAPAAPAPLAGPAGSQAKAPLTLFQRSQIDNGQPSRPLAARDGAAVAGPAFSKPSSNLALKADQAQPAMRTESESIIGLEKKLSRMGEEFGLSSEASPLASEPRSRQDGSQPEKPAAGSKSSLTAPLAEGPAPAGAAVAEGALGRKRKKEEGFLGALQDVDKAMVANPKDQAPEATPRNFKELARRGLLGRRPPEPPEATPRNFKELAPIADRLPSAKKPDDGEAFPKIVDNPFLTVGEHPLSTFSIDVDTASYSNVRGFLNRNTRPPADAVRIEEMVNYFPYSYPGPRAGEPFSVHCEVARCPWDAEHRLVRIGLKGREVEDSKRPPSNLVFLIDVSGSMQDLDKLPLLKAGMKLLVEQLGENDRIAIVVYASREGLALDSTRADRKAEILSSLEQLQAGGSTNGGKGIQLAFDLAVRNFIPGGTNRVILATDGDFNVGVTEGPDLDRLIEEKRKTGVALSVLGFGQGNVKHDKMESLADKGNGQYCFIDSIKEARKVLVEQMGGTLVTIAKDVKIQVVFDPDRTSSYRLIGYENRMLQARDFEDDKKDAGEIGAGHCVTALYEVVPPGQGVANLGNQKSSNLAQQAAKGNAKLLEVRLRFKAPDGDESRPISQPADDDGRDFAAASADFRFASAVAGFGMLLRDSPYKGSLTWDGLVELASGAIVTDPGGYRREFLELARKAKTIVAP